MRCFRVNCDENATHEIPFGEFGGAGLCDKHFGEFQNDPEEQLRFSRVR